jgi:hypothetical protein
MGRRQQHQEHLRGCQQEIHDAVHCLYRYNQFPACSGSMVPLVQEQAVATAYDGPETKLRIQ